jgi:hypothetical protein
MTDALHAFTSQRGIEWESWSEHLSADQLPTVQRELEARAPLPTEKLEQLQQEIAEIGQMNIDERMKRMSYLWVLADKYGVQPLRDVMADRGVANAPLPDRFSSIATTPSTIRSTIPWTVVENRLSGYGPRLASHVAKRWTCSSTTTGSITSRMRHSSEDAFKACAHPCQRGLDVSSGPDKIQATEAGLFSARKLSGPVRGASPARRPIAPLARCWPVN